MKKMIFVFLLVVSRLYSATDTPDKPANSPQNLKLSSPKRRKAAPTPKEIPNKLAPRAADPKALETINAYIKATGGKTTYEGINTRFEKFNVLRHTNTGITKALFTRYMKKPNMVREQWDLNVKVAEKQQLNVLQIYNGKTGEGWTKMMGFVDKLKGKSVHQLMHDKYLDDYFMHWKKDGFSLAYRAKGKSREEPCHVIDVYHATGRQRLRFFFSIESHLLLKKLWTSNTRNGPVQKERFYSEWRKVKDLKNPERWIMFRFYSEWRKVKDLKNPERWIMFPFKKETFQKGDLTRETEHMEIKINSNLGDELFKRPPGTSFENREKETKKKDKKKKLPPWLQKKKRKVEPKSKPDAETKTETETKHGSETD